MKRQLYDKERIYIQYPYNPALFTCMWKHHCGTGVLCVGLITALLKLGSGLICCVLGRLACYRIEKCQMFYKLHSPHVDQVLCESDRLGVPRHGDGAVHAAPHGPDAAAARRGRVAVLAVGDSDHCAAELATCGREGGANVIEDYDRKLR